MSTKRKERHFIYQVLKLCVNKSKNSWLCQVSEGQGPITCAHSSGSTPGTQQATRKVSLNASPLPPLPRPEGIGGIWDRKQCHSPHEGLHAPNQGSSELRLHRPSCHDYHSPCPAFLFKIPKQVLARSLLHTNEHLSCLQGRTWTESVTKKCAQTSLGCWTLNQCLMLFFRREKQRENFCVCSKTYSEPVWIVIILHIF